MAKGYKIKCRKCQKEALDIHHMDGDHFNNAPNNRVYLCRSCHQLEHRDSVNYHSYDAVDEMSNKRYGQRLLDAHYEAF